MNHDGDRVREVFVEVMDLQGADRDAALERLCVGDASLRAEVMSLLDHDQPGLAKDAPSETTRDDSRRPGESVGAYRLETLLGRGGFGEVWKARQSHPVDRIVAIKFLSGGAGIRDARGRFDFERQVLARLGHPGIARIIDADSLADGTPWFAMDFIEGEPLLDVVRSHHLSLDAAVDLLMGVCDAIGDAHRVGVIHLDLKSSNVLIDSGGSDLLRPVVIDFGIARLQAGAPGAAGGMIVGTPGAMAPEQAAGGDDIDTRADVWAIGALLSRVIEICPAMRGRRRQEMGWIIKRASAIDREDRFQSVDALRNELRRWRSGSPLRESGPFGVRRRFETLLREHRRFVGVITVAFLALLVVLGWSVQEQRRTEEALTRAEANRMLFRRFLGQFDRIDAGSLEKVRFKRLLAEAVAEIDGFGDADPLLVAEFREAIAVFAFAGGDAELMADQLEQVSEILTGDLGMEAGDPRVQRLRIKLAQARYNQGLFGESESISRSLLTESSSGHVQNRLVLAASLIAQEQRESEALLILESLDAREPEDSSHRGAIEFGMGRALVGLGRPEDAMPHYERSIGDLHDRFDVDHPAVLWRRIHLGEALLAAGRVDEAAVVIESTFAEQVNRVGDDHVNTHWMRERMGDLRVAQGRTEDAIGHYHASLEGRVRRLLPGHPDISDLREKIEALQARGSEESIPDQQ